MSNTSGRVCALTLCGRIFAQVDCIKYIMQGTSACIDIQFFNVDKKHLDLRDFSDIQIQLTNDFDKPVINFWYPSVPSGSGGSDIIILQETTTGGNIIDKGLIRICIPIESTYTTPGSIFAEIILKQQVNTGISSPTDSSYGIPCIYVAKIIESKIALNSNKS